jgi:hypothetical protein
MQMEDWLHDPVNRNDETKSKLIGIAVAVLGTRAALNNRVLNSDEYKAVCKLVQNFALLNEREAHSLTYFAMQTRGNPQLEELSVDIITAELSESDFIQLLDAIVEILEMDGVLCSEDVRLLTDFYELIKHCVERDKQKNKADTNDLINTVKIFLDSVFEDTDIAEQKTTMTGLRKAS